MKEAVFVQLLHEARVDELLGAHTPGARIFFRDLIERNFHGLGGRIRNPRDILAEIEIVNAFEKRHIVVLEILAENADGDFFLGPTVVNDVALGAHHAQHRVAVVARKSAAGVESRGGERNP